MHKLNLGNKFDFRISLLRYFLCLGSEKEAFELRILARSRAVVRDENAPCRSRNIFLLENYDKSIKCSIK